MNRKLPGLLLLLLFSCSHPTAPSPANEYPVKVLNMESLHSYAYAPSIMRMPEGTLNLWACSGATETGDSVVFTSSADGGLSWSPYKIALHAFDTLDTTRDGYYSNACDPSVVYANGYFWLFFSGTRTDVQTYNGVARSRNAEGPYAVYVEDGSWSEQVDSTHRPKPIQVPANRCNGPEGCYGAGEPSVIFKDGKFLMWYSDTTQYPFIRYTESVDATTWTAPVPTNVTDTSVDIKWDPQTQQFIMFGIANSNYLNAAVTIRRSSDGINWTEILSYHSTPPFSHNVGVSGDLVGFIIDDASVSYGAPYKLFNPAYNNDQPCSTDRCWGHWDLWLQPISLR